MYTNNHNIRQKIAYDYKCQYLCINNKYVVMAIAIKSIPVLKEKPADEFNRSAEASIAKKSTVKFAKQIAATSKILAKAKL